VKISLKNASPFSLILSLLLLSHLSLADSWGPLIELRDTTNTFSTNDKPSSGWIVTPIHATLLTSGKVLITGWGRRDQNSCVSGGTRKNGTSFLLDPNTLPNGGILNIQPLNEAQEAGTSDVLYCAGHTPLADGRILHTGGARYENLGASNQVEFGLNYSRLYSASNNTFSKINSPMLGGRAGMAGMAWYPTNTRLADGKVMVIGGFSRCCDTNFSNLTLQTFDPIAQDQSQNPWSLISPNDETPVQLKPGLRDYIHSFLLPNALRVNNVDRTMAIMGKDGAIFYVNTEAGTPNNQRFTAAPNGQRFAGGEDGTAALLSTGEIMTAGGTNDNNVSQKIDLYQPSTSTWRSLETFIGRRNASSVLLPDGTVLLISGDSDERNFTGDRRKPQIIDPQTGTVTTLNPWTGDSNERGYHNFAILLKDGRVLIGGGISSLGGIGCERSDLRIYNPPYLTNGARPVISNAPAFTSMNVGGSPLNLNFSGASLKVSDQGGVVLMAVGSTTHSFDQNQRYVKLAYTQSGSALTINPPANTQIAPPGDYILYLVSQSGAPSMGVTVRIEKAQINSSSNASSSVSAATPFHLRGTQNGWAEGDLFSAVAGSTTNFQICRNFTVGDGGGGPRFKIDPNGGWGTDSFPATDVVASGWTKVVINGNTRVVLSTTTNMAVNCGGTASSSSSASLSQSSSSAPAASSKPAQSSSSGAVVAVVTILKPTVVTQAGQSVFVVGNQLALSNWNSAAGVPCTQGAANVWTCQGFSFVAGTQYQYKYIKRNLSGVVEWEGGNNRTRTAPSTTSTFTETWQ
jgi:Domain of unknown function (DUF1929)/Starch binding domain